MKVVINGAGIAGLTLAQRLSVAGAEVVLLEKAPRPRTSGYLIDFFGPGYDAAEAMGLLPSILQRGYRIDEIAYCDESGHRRAGLGIARLAGALGGRLVSLLRSDLEGALREHLSNRVDERFARTVTAVENRADGVTVTLSDGGTVTADLLVGCDGIHSVTRALAFGPEQEHVRHLGLHTAAFTFDDSAARVQVGERFWMTDTLHRTMGFYRLRGGEVAVFAAHRTGDRTLPADPRAALRREYGALGGNVPRALAACPPPEHLYYDQVAQSVVPAWSRGRVTLLGDAAYAVSLLAGQGASLAVAGAYLLAEQLTRQASVDSALAAYERQLRPLVLTRQRAARAGLHWFVPTSRRDQWLRRVALQLAALPHRGRSAG